HLPSAEISDRELRLLRMRSQGLLDEARSPSLAKAVSAALAIQAQEPPVGLLGVRARTTLTAAEAVRGSARASVCRAWLMRNTIFLFATRDLAWMRPALRDRPLVPAMRRLKEVGLPPPKVERLLDLLRERLAGGPLPRPEARKLLLSVVGEPGENNARIYWTFHAAALRGVLVVRPALESVQTFVPAPEDEEIPRERALGRLARRYLRAHGPATPDDLAYWAKMTKADARHGWENAGRTVEVRTERGSMTALPGTLDPPAPERARVRLLGEWDHYLLSWADKGVALGAERAADPFAAGRRLAFADGLAFATWALRREKGRIEVEVEPFGPVPRGARSGLEAEVADLGRFFDADPSLRVVRA
ncbi:MAG: winged helix DNA-binding domain-containing protein, partial [Solirubrobacterales bacterium]